MRDRRCLSGKEAFGSKPSLIELSNLRRSRGWRCNERFQHCPVLSDGLGLVQQPCCRSQRRVHRQLAVDTAHKFQPTYNAEHNSSTMVSVVYLRPSYSVYGKIIPYTRGPSEDVKSHWYPDWSMEEFPASRSKLADVLVECSVSLTRCYVRY